MTNYYGIIMGISTIILTGLGHIVVIKGEYYFGTKIWTVFLAAGIAAALTSLFVKSSILSGFLGILSFTLFWSILEIFKQKKRVEKGWFPKKK